MTTGPDITGLNTEGGSTKSGPGYEGPETKVRH